MGRLTAPLMPTLTFFVSKKRRMSRCLQRLEPSYPQPTLVITHACAQNSGTNPGNGGENNDNNKGGDNGDRRRNPLAGDFSPGCLSLAYLALSFILWLVFGWMITAMARLTLTRFLLLTLYVRFLLYFAIWDLVLCAHAHARLLHPRRPVARDMLLFKLRHDD